jgi:transposase
METNVIEFEQLIERGCGLDVHEKTVVATVDGKGLEKQTKTFDTFTSSLKELNTWLKERGITHVAMESTGIYWKPVFNILEDDLTVILVNARHLKNVPGRKTDKIDSEWICKLLLSGLLKGSFIPPQRVRDMRDLSRYATKLTGQLASEKNRIQKILEDANIKLSSVLTDTSGVVSTKLIDGIIDGRTDLKALIDESYHKKLKAGKETLLEALTGKLTDHHRFMLQQIRSHINELERHILEIDRQMDNLLAESYELLELLKSIPGVGKETAVKIIAEIGTDMSVFPDERHLAKWAGMCPGNNESGGKKKSSRVTHGNKYLRSALVEAAWAASHTKNTYLRAKYDSLVGRKGKKKALITLGHKILCAAYHILQNKVRYKELGVEWYEKERKSRRIKYLKLLLSDKRE